jgi:hypothetical protein
MSGEAIDIVSSCPEKIYVLFESAFLFLKSGYSQYFTRLPSLVALDVAIRSLDQYCPCGHEVDSRLSHIQEGTAMGRLCRRMRHPTGIQVVRLSPFGWYPHSAEHERVPHEINWIQRPEEAVRNIERICGPCEDELAAVRKIFDPVSWMTA